MLVDAYDTDFLYADYPKFGGTFTPFTMEYEDHLIIGILDCCFYPQFSIVKVQNEV